MAFSNWKKSILHRGAVMAAVCLLAGVAVAQRPGQRKKSTPRALAVVEWPAKGVPRLVPICILVNGQYYDAGIYLADPVPISLDSGNVYEVEKTGDPQGYFTVAQAQQAGDNWYGLGSFRSMEQVHVAQKPKSDVTMGAAAADKSDEPPRLHRGNQPKAPATPQPAPPEANPVPAPAPSQPSGDEPPVLRKPSQPPSESAPPQAPAPTAEQGTSSPSASAPASSSNEEDPNRPVLRRGKPAAEMAPETIEPPKSAVTSSAAPGKKPAGIENPAAVTKVLPAISDAKGPESRNYAFDWTAQEQERITRGMQDLARASLQEYLKGRGDAAGPLQDVQVKAFDLDLTNEAVFVVTATTGTAPPAPPRAAVRGRRPPPEPEPQPVAKPLTFFITVVARQDLEGHLRRIYRRVTDTGHLDAYSRLELIDAVDVDGDGRGELLFRSINDQSSAFVVFRATVDTLTQLFNSRDLEQ